MTWLKIDQVLGDGPFRVIGRPCCVAGPHHDLVAVGGHLGTPQWMGHDVQSGPIGSAAWYRLGVFRLPDVECIHLLPIGRAIHALAFHPEQPILAIGWGSYDGGWCYEGALEILDLRSGRRTSILDERREVLGLRWAESGDLSAVLAGRDDGEIGESGVEAVEVVVDRRDWSSCGAGSVGVRSLPTRPVGRPRGDQVPVTEIEHWARASGPARDSRRLVWAVEALPDGGCVASLEGVEAERWTRDGTRVWSIPTAGVGCQLIVDPTGTSALVNVEPPTEPRSWPPTRPPSIVDRVTLDDGAFVPAAEMSTTVVLASCTDGTWAARSTSLGSEANPSTVVFRANDTAVDELPVGPYDLFNHFLAVRNAPRLLMLEGRGDRAHQDKWVIELQPGQDVQGRPLFPLEWDQVRDGHLFGGPAVFVDDWRGAALVHAGAVHDGRGLLPGNSFVVRRSFPDGALVWHVTTDSQATAMDERDGVVLVAYNTGWLLALRAVDGAELGRAELVVRGHAVVPLSLSLGPDGDVVVGTLDGRIVRASISLPAD